MYKTNCNDEAVIRIIGKISQEFTDFDDLQKQITLRKILEEVLYKYEVVTKETGLITTDLDDKLKMYIAVKKLDGLSAKTLKNYHYELTTFGNFMRKPLSSVTTNDLRMFLAVRCKEMKPSSTNSVMSYLKTFFSWLADEEYIPKDPAKRLKPTKEPKRLRHALSDEEVELLRQACVTDREKALIELLVSSGIRLSEAVQINKSSVDWYERSFRVIGKGNKERKVYFSTKAKILLKKYLSTRKDEHEALFVTVRRPYGRLGNRAIQKEVKNIAKRAKFDKSVYPHLFRHSFATHNINSGMPLTVLQQLMGHESPDTTLIYSEVSQENIKHEYMKIS